MPRKSRLLELRSTHLSDVHDVGGVGEQGRLRVRVYAGRVTASIPETSRYSAPPTFRGVVGDDGVLRGRIRESRTNVLWPSGYLFCTLLMCAVLVFGIVGLAHGGVASGALAPTLIGAFATPTFAALWLVFRSSRRQDWADRSMQLEVALEREIAGLGHADPASEQRTGHDRTGLLTPLGGQEPRSIREGLRAFTDPDIPVAAEVATDWSNYRGAKPPVFLSLVFLGVLAFAGMLANGAAVELPSPLALVPAGMALGALALAAFCFFPLRRIWRAALRARIDGERS